MENCKNNVTMQTTTDNREFVRQTIMEAQRLCQQEFPAMPFPKFVYSMAHQPGRSGMINEIIRQAGKQFGCEVYQVREKGKQQKDAYDP